MLIFYSRMANVVTLHLAYSLQIYNNEADLCATKELIITN